MGKSEYILAQVYLLRMYPLNLIWYYQRREAVNNCMCSYLGAHFCLALYLLNFEEESNMKFELLRS